MKKITTKEFKEKVEILHGENLKILGTYNGMFEKVMCECINGHIFNGVPHNILRQKYPCINCNPRKTKTKKDAIEMLSKYNMCLVGQFKGFNFNTLVKCSCGVEYEVRLNALCQTGSKCYSCGNRDRDERFLERNKDKFMDIRSCLYVIKCFNDNESFYKIGHTSQSIKSRFSCNMPYLFKIEYCIKMSRYQAWKKEIEIIRNNAENRYFPKIKFAGYTECFNNNIVFDLTSV